MDLGKMNLSLSLDGLQRKIDTFEFIPGKTPVSTIYHVLGAVSLYLLTLVVLKRVMAKREPLKLKGLLAVHNLTLSSFSLVALIAVLYYIVPIWVNRGIYDISCDPKRDIYGRGPVVFWFYLFYLSKMYEFLDTVFQVLRKKSLQFLHVYHHCITLMLCWVTIVEGNPMQWADISANLFVHVIMYYYYYISDKGIVVWWKRYITTIQIIQFIWDLGWHIGWFVVAIWQQPANQAPVCAGTMPGFYFSNFVIASFLFLFLRFYFRTYKPKPGKPKTQ